MQLETAHYTLTLSEETGAIIGFSHRGRQMIAAGAERPLFILKFLTGAGNAEYRRPTDFARPVILREDMRTTLTYHSPDLTVTAAVRCPEGPDSFWHIAVKNHTGNLLEWVDFPGVTVPDDLIASDGDARLFWPAMEGFLVEDSTLREKNGPAYKETGEQSGGYAGIYPGPCPMQFMAYYAPEAGMYFAAHDRDANLKTVEFHREIAAAGGICLEYRVFTEGAAEHWSMPYEMALGTFTGDWYDAAAHYRDWLQRDSSGLPPKLCENTRLPAWLSDSPIVALYPVRGTKDTGDMTPNLYYPYENVLPYIDSLAAATESRMMALPMHWEGTAPWAPPYVWPPFGGEAAFQKFADALHRRGHLLGVYCSGIGWTTYSFLNPAYDPGGSYDAKLMCQTPQGEILQSKVLGAPIRHGYDMCPQSPTVAETVAQEVASIAAAGCDYAQYFDQNLGGNSSVCYAKDHGHPPAPGKWQSDAMIRIFTKVQQALDTMKSPMLIGCEGAASQPFIGALPFNDLRFEIGMSFAKPVPAYSFVFHEYLNNFMGNQNCIDSCYDMLENPDNLLFRTAYAFTSGDLLTLVLAEGGSISWAWTVPWALEAPDQTAVKTLMRNLNAWRQKEGKPYLHTGRMLKPSPLKGCDTYTLKRKDGGCFTFPALLTSKWESPAGGQAQFLVNYTHASQTVEPFWRENALLYTAPGKPAQIPDGNVTVPPLSALMLEFS